MTTSILPNSLCPQCITKNLNQPSHQQKKPNHCINCQKPIDILFNKDPYCITCYIQYITSPSKTQRGSRATKHTKTRSFFISIDQDEIINIKKSFLAMTGKIIKKISKLFDEKSKDKELVDFLKKNAMLLNNCDWDKFITKVGKSSNIVYIFIDKSKIVGAFHSKKINIESSTSSICDEEAGIFSTNRFKFQLQFARVTSDSVLYNCRNKTVKFGNPPSFQITFGKTIKMVTELVPDMEWTQSFLYDI